MSDKDALITIKRSECARMPAFHLLQPLKPGMTFVELPIKCASDHTRGIKGDKRSEMSWRNCRIGVMKQQPFPGGNSRAAV